MGFSGSGMDQILVTNWKQSDNYVIAKETLYKQ